MKRLLGVLLLAVGLLATGAQAAELVNVSGQVQLLAADGSLRKLAAIGDHVESGESVRTLDKSTAMIRQDGGQYTALTANSQVKIEGAGVVEQVRGAVYYVLRKLSASTANQEPRKVKSSVATIGIRGTRFLVTTEGEDGRVALTEGLIQMTANEGESFSIEKYPGDMTFEQYREAQDKLFRKFVKDDKEAFDAWRKQQLKEFEAFKQEFFLMPDQSVAFDDGKVRYEKIPQDDAKLLAELDALVRQQEKADEAGGKSAP